MRSGDAKRSGGILLGLVVAMVVVGVISAAMVKSLRGQAGNTTHAYNMMRARYAAESGRSFFLNATNKMDYVDHGWVEHTMLNGDVFRLSVSTNETYYLVTSSGRMVAGSSVLAVRSIRFQKKRISGSGDLTEEGETPVLELDEDLEVVTNVVSEIDQEILDYIQDERTLHAEAKDFHVLTGNEKNDYEATLEEQQSFTNRNGRLYTDLNGAYGLVTEYGTGKDVGEHLNWAVAYPLNYVDEVAAASQANGGYLAYEVQAKFEWENSEGANRVRKSGAQGVAFKFSGPHAADTHNQSSDKKKAHYSFYAATLMVYQNLPETGNIVTDAAMLGSEGIRQYWDDFDGIPNEIKPHDVGNDLNGKLLLVIWKQWWTGSENTPELNRIWLGYQDLTTLGEAGTYSWFNDATLNLRVVEGADVDGSYIDLQCFVGDAHATGSGNNEMTDRGAGRRAYKAYGEANSAFLTWPPVDLDKWSSDTDFYTASVMSNSFVVNPVVSNEISALDDGVTLRFRDDGALFNLQQDSQADLAYLFCGNFLSGADNLNSKKTDVTVVDSLYMAVDDFAMRFFLTGSSSGDDEIITDF